MSLYGQMYCWGQAKCPLHRIARWLHFRGFEYLHVYGDAFLTRQSVHIIIDVLIYQGCP